MNWLDVGGVEEKKGKPHKERGGLLPLERLGPPLTRILRPPLLVKNLRPPLMTRVCHGELDVKELR
jgi:hypothetical protein